MTTSADPISELVAWYDQGRHLPRRHESRDARRDQLIRGMLELDGYKVIVVQPRHLNDTQAVRQHLRNIAEAMGRADLA